MSDLLKASNHGKQDEDIASSVRLMSDLLKFIPIIARRQAFSVLIHTFILRLRAERPISFVMQGSSALQVLYLQNIRNDVLKAFSSSKLPNSSGEADFEFIDCFDNDSEDAMNLYDAGRDEEFSDVEEIREEEQIWIEPATAFRGPQGGMKKKKIGRHEETFRNERMTGPIWELVKSINDIATVDNIDEIFMKIMRRTKLSLDEVACLARVIRDLVNNLQESIQKYILPNCDALLRRYPELSKCLPAELCYLLKFCNAMRVGKELIPASLHKQLLLDLCSNVEGSGKTYITGSGAKESTKIRVHMYERECSIQASCRRGRSNPPRSINLLAPSPSSLVTPSPAFPSHFPPPSQ